MINLKSFWKNKVIFHFSPGFFLRNVTTVITGNIVAKLIAVAASPLLTRLFLPDDFGILAIFTSVSGIIAVILTLKYDMAIVLPKEERDAKLLFGIAIKLSLIMSLIIIVLITVVAFTALDFLGLGEIPPYALILSVVVAFLIAIEHAFNYWNIRKKAFRLITVSLVLGTLIGTLFKFGGGVISTGAWPLLLGTIIIHAITVGVQVYKDRNNNLFHDGLKSLQNKAHKKAILGRYSDFPKYRMPQNLLEVISQNLPAIMLIAFFNPAAGGFYALSQRVVQLPGVIISEGIRKVFYQKAAELSHGNSSLFRTSVKTTAVLGAVGIIPFGLIIIFSPILFSFIFGEEWNTAGIYASWLGIWLYFIFCRIPAICIVPIIDLQKRYFIFNLIMVIITLMALAVGLFWKGALGSIIVYSIIGALLNIFLIIDVHRNIYKFEINKLKEEKK